MAAQNINEPQTESGAAHLSLRAVSLILVFIGVVISGYLSYVKLAEKEVICRTSGELNCNEVLSSPQAELLGIPIAYLGLATYLVIGALLLLENRSSYWRETGLLLLFGLISFAFLYSVYLVYLQGLVIGAWCQWCLTHEATMTVLFIVTSLRLKRALANTPQ